MKDFFAIEGAGARPSEIPLTRDEERVLMIMEGTTCRVGNRLETGLIWKDDQVEFPDSYIMAVGELECLKRRMNRDDALKENLQVREYEAKGYAHQAAVKKPQIHEGCGITSPEL